MDDSTHVVIQISAEIYSNFNSKANRFMDEFTRIKA